MILLDVNVLVHAFREASPDHAGLPGVAHDGHRRGRAVRVVELVLSGFVRIATHPRVFDPPAPVGEALAFVGALRSQPNAVIIAPGTRHWEIFAGLCAAAGAKGNLVADAYLAALAIESGCEWITADRNFSRFPGLRWRHPLADT